MSEAAQTAYGKSIAVAQALMASAQKQMTDLERMEQENANVKKAFRTAFEYWADMQPFVPSVEFFQVAADKMKERFNESNQDSLTESLLHAVYDYFNDMAASQKQTA